MILFAKMVSSRLLAFAFSFKLLLLLAGLFIAITTKSQCPSDSLDFSWSLTGGCQPVNFNSYVNFGNGNYTYLWDFGNNDKTDNALKNPVHVYVDASGSIVSYTVTLKVTDSKKNTCTVTKVLNIKTTSIVIADTSLSQTFPFVHCTVQGDTCGLDVVDRSSVKLGHYRIEWGDGNVFDSTGFPKVLSHKYNNQQLYTIKASSGGSCISYNYFCGNYPANGITCPPNRLACQVLDLDFKVADEVFLNAKGTQYTVDYGDGSAIVRYEQDNLPGVLKHSYNGNLNCNPMMMQVKATNPCGSTPSQCFPIAVSTKPDPDIGIVRKFSQHDCANLTQYTFKDATSPCCIKIDGSKDNGVKLRWEINPKTYKLVKGLNLDSTEVTVIFKNKDCYDVRMIVEYKNQTCSKCGDTGITTRICLDTLAVSKFIASAKNNYATCGLPFSVNFTNLSTGADSYLWKVIPKTIDPKFAYRFINNTNENSVNPSISFQAADTFRVVLSAINDCGSSDYYEDIIIVSPPEINLKKPLTFCGPESFTLRLDTTSVKFANVNYHTAYKWVLSPSTGVTDSICNLMYPVFTFNKQHLTSYKLKVYVDNKNGCLPWSDSTIINFTDKPDITVNIDKSSVCKGDTITLTAKDNSINNGNNLIFQWTQQDSTGGLMSFYGSKVNGIPDMSTSYYLKAYLNTDTMCRDMQTLTVKVNQLPNAAIFPKDTTICAGDPIELKAFGGVTFKWMPGNYTTQSITVNPTVNTTYIVKVTSTDGCSNSDSVRINVIEIPKASFIVKSIEFEGNELEFNNTSTGASSFEWNFGDNNSSDDFFPFHTYNVAGDYIVKLKAISDNGCQAETTEKIKILKNIKPFQIQPDSGCTPVTGRFVNNIKDPELKFFWKLGINNLTSTQITPAPVIYSTTKAEEYFKITVYVIYNNDSAKYSFNIHVYNKPLANFTLTPNCGCPILTVNMLNYTQSALPYSSGWDFGNGLKVFESIHSQHKPQSSQYKGIPADSTYYVVTLKDSNRCGVSYFKDTVTVYPNNISVSFNADKNVSCVDEAIKFTNRSRYFNSVMWEFGDGERSLEENPFHSYRKSGTYKVRLTAYNQCNACGGIVVIGSSVDSMYVTINDLPDAEFITDNKHCQNDVVSFIIKNPGLLSDVSWDFGDPASGIDNTSKSFNPSHKYTKPGAYTVTLTAKSLPPNVCTNTFVLDPLIIDSVPYAMFTDTFKCRDVHFINKSKYFNVCHWDFGDSTAISTKTNPDHTYEKEGKYNVRLTVFNKAGCSSSYGMSVNMPKSPESNFDYSSDNDNANDRFNVSFYNMSSDTCNYTWYFGDSTSSNLQNPVHTYSPQQTYLATLIVEDINNCISKIEKLIYPKPKAYFDEKYNCNEIEFNNLSKNFTKSTFYFGDNDSVVNKLKPVHTYPAPGKYTAVLKVSNEKYIDVFSKDIFIFHKPEAEFDYKSTNQDENSYLVNFSNLSTDSCTYYWDFGDGTYSTDKEPLHTFNDLQAHTVKLVVTNKSNCTDIQFRTIEPAGPGDFYIPNAFTPEYMINNKFPGKYNLSSPKMPKLSTYHMKIFNRWGELLFESFDFDNQWDGSYNGKPCPDGMYVYVITLKFLAANAETRYFTGNVTLLRRN